MLTITISLAFSPGYSKQHSEAPAHHLGHVHQCNDRVFLVYLDTVAKRVLTVLPAAVGGARIRSIAKLAFRSN